MLEVVTAKLADLWDEGPPLVAQHYLHEDVMVGNGVDDTDHIRKNLHPWSSCRIHTRMVVKPFGN